jgi:hypothetical protein
MAQLGMDWFLYTHREREREREQPVSAKSLQALGDFTTLARSPTWALEELRPWLGSSRFHPCIGEVSPPGRPCAISTRQEKLWKQRSWRACQPGVSRPMRRTHHFDDEQASIHERWNARMGMALARTTTRLAPRKPNPSTRRTQPG